MNISIQDLVLPARIAMSVTAAFCALSFWQAFKNRDALNTKKDNLFYKALLIWMSLSGGTAIIFTHTTLIQNAGQYLPFGVVPGFILAISSLFWQPSIDAFDSLKNSNIQFLMSYRTIFGAFLFAGAGLSLFPPVFALFAGLGDMLAGWLAAGAIGKIDSNENKKWRWIVHGWGALDLIDVAILGTFVVRPWIMETGSLGPSLLLPWVAVPLLFALNLHGVRQLIRNKKIRV